MEIRKPSEDTGMVTYWIIQECGASGEWYPKRFATYADAQKHREECDCETSPVFEIPSRIADAPGVVKSIADNSNKLTVEIP